MKGKILIILSFLYVYDVNAAHVWLESKIESIYPQGDGKVVIIFDKKSESCSTNYHYIEVNQNGVNQQGLNNIYSAALAAAAAGKTVKVNFDENSESCYINRLTVDFN